MDEIMLIPAVIAGVFTEKEENYRDATEELERLCEALGLEVVGALFQELKSPHPASYLGPGKLMELSDYVRESEAEAVVFLDTLSPAQLKNITDALDCIVYDRTGLILEIFNRRAKTREAKLQVEVANLKYRLPRLVGMRKNLGRQAGASGSQSNRGQGEKQIELDRRHIEKRITQLEKNLKEIEHNRETMRRAREKSHLPKVALVGYTNAGKSTLLNKLLSLYGEKSEKQVFEKDTLFATLDTNIRRINPGDNKDFLLSDTVGFVSNLPHGLVKAFRSTLDEVKYADLLLIVVDASDASKELQLQVTEDTLRALNIPDIPRLIVMNKCDRTEETRRGVDPSNGRVYISAKSGEGLDSLLGAVKDKVYGDSRIITLLIPFNDGKSLSLINENSRVISREYNELGTLICADCPGRVAESLRDLILP